MYISVRNEVHPHRHCHCFQVAARWFISCRCHWPLQSGWEITQTPDGYEVFAVYRTGERFKGVSGRARADARMSNDEGGGVSVAKNHALRAAAREFERRDAMRAWHREMRAPKELLHLHLVENY